MINIDIANTNHDIENCRQDIENCRVHINANLSNPLSLAALTVINLKFKLILKFMTIHSLYTIKGLQKGS